MSLELTVPLQLCLERAQLSFWLVAEPNDPQTKPVGVFWDLGTHQLSKLQFLSQQNGLVHSNFQVVFCFRPIPIPDVE